MSGNGGGSWSRESSSYRSSTPGSGNNLNSSFYAPKILLNSGSGGTNTPTSGTRPHSNMSTRFNSPTRNLQEEILKNTPAYKQIKINTEDSTTNFQTPEMIPAVSFDTIEKDFLDDRDRYGGDDDENYFNYRSNDDDGDDGDNDDEYDEMNLNQRLQRTTSHDPSLSSYLSPSIPRGRGGPGGNGGGSSRDRSLSPYNRDLSPMRSNTFSSLNSIEGVSTRGKVDANGWRIDYPSRPGVLFDSYTLTFKDPNFDTYIKEHDNYRTIVIYITGRKHSWVALDFAVDKCLKNGDHLIITSRIPLQLFEEDFHMIRGRRRGSKSIERKKRKSLKETANNIKKYLEFLISPNKIAKYTIDLFLSESTSSVLKEIIKIYDPATIITSTKPNAKFKRRQTWNTTRITDRLVQKFHLPIVVVPAFSMNEYEVDFINRKISEKQLNDNIDKLKEKLKDFDISASTIPTIPSSKRFLSSNLDDNSSNKIGSDISSIGSSSINTGTNNNNDHDISEEISVSDSEDSDTGSDYSDDDDDDSNTSSVRALTRTISNYQDILEDYIEDLESHQVTEGTFLEKLNKITDVTDKISRKFRETSDNGGEGAALVRTLTGLPEVEKTKSMLDVLEPPKTNEEAMKNLKKSLKHSNKSNPPTPNNGYSKLLNHKVEEGGGSNSGSATPNKSITFSSDLLDTKKLKKNALKNEYNNPLSRSKTQVETHHHSHGDSNGSNGGLSPTRSQPQGLMKSLSESKVDTLETHKEKKKKNKWSFFKLKGSSSRRPSTS